MSQSNLLGPGPKQHRSHWQSNVPQMTPQKQHFNVPQNKVKIVIPSKNGQPASPIVEAEEKPLNNILPTPTNLLAQPMQETNQQPEQVRINIPQPQQFNPQLSTDYSIKNCWGFSAFDSNQQTFDNSYGTSTLPPPTYDNDPYNSLFSPPDFRNQSVLYGNNSSSLPYDPSQGSFMNNLFGPQFNQSTFPYNNQQPPYSPYNQHYLPNFPKTNSTYLHFVSATQYQYQVQTNTQLTCKFFTHVSNHDPYRDYVFVVDKSGSMSDPNKDKTKTLFQETQCVIEKFVDHICTWDPDGPDLYLFSSDFTSEKNVKNPETVKEFFKRNSPSGSTDMVLPLSDAFKTHFDKKSTNPNQRTTLLVITDGQPDSEIALKNLLISTANRVNDDEELSVSFIQVGNNSSATTFLKSLDDQLKTPIDIVDTISYDQIIKSNMSFEEFMQLSLYS